MTHLEGTNLQPGRTVADEAARWFVLLQEASATPETFREWQQWLNADPEHRRTYDEIENTALRVSRTLVVPSLPSSQEMERDSYDGSVSILEWKQTTGMSRRGFQDPATARERRLTGTRPLQWSRFAIAAGLAFAAFCGVWLWVPRDSRPHPSDTFRTGPGQRQVVMLPEGSRVTLDADSALEVSLTVDRRSFVLRHGEAFFQVAKDRQRPFVVRTGTAQVTAVGTAFNVRLSDDRTVVAVTEGKVEFVAMPSKDVASVNASKPAETALSTRQPTLAAEVSAGEAVSYVEDGRLQALPAQSAPLATSWLDGHRQYRDEPLRYVLTDIDRYTGQRIRLGDSAAGELRFTGTLNLQNSAAWLRGLSFALPVILRQDADGAVVIEHK